MVPARGAGPVALTKDRSAPIISAKIHLSNRCPTKSSLPTMTRTSSSFSK
jgi:hypothetical protein